MTPDAMPTDRVRGTAWPTVRSCIPTVCYSWPFHDHPPSRRAPPLLVAASNDCGTKPLTWQPLNEVGELNPRYVKSRIVSYPYRPVYLQPVLLKHERHCPPLEGGFPPCFGLDLMLHSVLHDADKAID